MIPLQNLAPFIFVWSIFLLLYYVIKKNEIGKVNPPIADMVNAGRPLLAGVRSGMPIHFRHLQW